jgi:TPR repeat protein
MTATTIGSLSEGERLFNEAYRHEEDGDLKRAFQCLLAGARLGDSGCQVNLGNFYAAGTGTRKDMAAAAYWYRKGYRNGDRTGALNLAIDHRNAGRTRSAVIWFKKAIAMNDGDSCIHLAKIYMQRKGGRSAAISLLKQVLPMNRSDVSKEGKEEAKSLLQTIAVQDVTADLSGAKR